MFARAALTGAVCQFTPCCAQFYMPPPLRDAHADADFLR